MNNNTVSGAFNYDGLLVLFQDSFNLILLVIFVMGLILMLTSLLQFKNVHSVNYRGGQGVSVTTPIIGLVVGVFFMYFPTTMEVLDMTFLGQSNPINPYGNRGEGIGANNMWKTLDMVYKIFGVVAIVKGFLTLRSIGQQQNNPNEGSTIGKGIGYIVFGYVAYQHEVFFSMLGDYIPILKNFANPIAQGFGIN